MRRLREAAPKFSPKAFFAQSPRSFIMLVAFGIVGTALLVASQAATPTSSFETELGTVTGASIEDGSDASGGKYVRFGQPYTDLFVSTTGSNSNNGSSEAQAVQTITKAVSLATDYTRIRVKAGTYVETVSIQKSNLKIEPFGNGDVTINGAIKEFVTGVNWSNQGNGIYKYTLNRDEYNSNGNPIYDSTGKQWWSYNSLAGLQNRQTTSQLPGVFFNTFLFSYDVYVATDNNLAPTAPMNIAGTKPTIDILNATNVGLKGLNNSKLKIVYGNQNIQIRTSTNISIDDVDITGGRAGIAALDSSNVVLKNNEVHGTFDPTWDWSDVKEIPGTHTMENQGILVRAQSRNISNVVVDNNRVSGYFNGINLPYNWGSVGSTKYFNEDSVVSNNTVYDVSDDGIEIEAPLHNLVVKGNTVHDAYSPLSATTVIEGPVYVYENQFVANRVIPYSFGTQTRGPSYAIKMNNDANGGPPENIHYYYNTFYFAGGNVNLKKTVQTDSNTITHDVSYINNIFYSYEGGIIRGSGRAQDAVEWDGNVFYSAQSTPYNYWSWNNFYSTDNVNTYSSLSAIISGGAMPSQWQGNVEGNPTFNCVDPLNASCFRASAAITKPSTMQQIPTGFAESSRLNSRKRIGAFE